jgi:hypothetical protein
MRLRWTVLVLLVTALGCSREPEPNSAPSRPGASAASETAVAYSSGPELAKKADIPVYPGADFPNEASNIRKDNQEVRYEIVLRTKAERADVENFYREQLKKADRIGDTIMGMTPKGNFAIVAAVPDDNGLTRVTIVVRATEEE